MGIVSYLHEMPGPLAMVVLCHARENWLDYLMLTQSM